MTLDHRGRHGRPLHWFSRLIFGIFGASAGIAGPLINKLTTEHPNLPWLPGTQAADMVYFGVLGCLWLVSILLTAYLEESHPLKCFIDAVGLPGLFISGTMGGAAIIH
jgi:hypothetical protein